MNKTLIFTENVHDTYTLTVLKLLLLRGDELTIMTPRMKLDRLRKANAELISEVAFFPLLDHILIRKRFIARIFSFINGRRNLGRFKAVLSAKEIDEVFFLESYNSSFNNGFCRIRDRFKNVRCRLTIHNINQYVSDYKRFSTDFKDFRLRKPKKSNVRFFEYMDNYVVVADALVASLRRFTGKCAQVIPFSLTDQNDICERKSFLHGHCMSGPIRFVVPGVVSEKRKPYKMIIDAFSKLLGYNFELVFLGPLYEESICAYAQERAVTIRTFNDYISMQKFSKIISEAHFLIGYVNEQLPYGLFKASGVEFDGAKHGVPVIVKNKKIVTSNGEFVVAENLFETLKNLIGEYNSGLWKTKYGLSAFDKMENNTAEAFLMNKISD